MPAEECLCTEQCSLMVASISPHIKVKLDCKIYRLCFGLIFTIMKLASQQALSLTVV